MTTIKEQLIKNTITRVEQVISVTTFLKNKGVIVDYLTVHLHEDSRTHFWYFKDRFYDIIFTELSNHTAVDDCCQKIADYILTGTPLPQIVFVECPICGKEVPMSNTCDNLSYCQDCEYWFDPYHMIEGLNFNDTEFKQLIFDESDTH